MGLFCVGATYDPRSNEKWFSGRTCKQFVKCQNMDGSISISKSINNLLYYILYSHYSTQIKASSFLIKRE